MIFWEKSIVFVFTREISRNLTKNNKKINFFLKTSKQVLTFLKRGQCLKRAHCLVMLSNIVLNYKVKRSATSLLICNQSNYRCNCPHYYYTYHVTRVKTMDTCLHQYRHRHSFTSIVDIEISFFQITMPYNRTLTIYTQQRLVVQLTFNQFVIIYLCVSKRMSAPFISQGNVFRKKPLLQR